MKAVAPFTGAWIEMHVPADPGSARNRRSHPSRVRGLKLLTLFLLFVTYFVAPFTGAWIEIGKSAIFSLCGDNVAPFTGAWIEITLIVHHGNLAGPSHPSRVRGLKYTFTVPLVHFQSVAPFTGAWIEIDHAQRITYSLS